MTAVCSPLVVASGASTTGFGRARPGVAVAALQAGIVVRRLVTRIANKARDIENTSEKPIVYKINES
jgi:hypothetical protein